MILFNNIELGQGDLVTYLDKDELEVTGIITELWVCGCIVSTSNNDPLRYIIYDDILRFLKLKQI